jgi:hypothetical protein
MYYPLLAMQGDYACVLAAHICLTCSDRPDINLVLALPGPACAARYESTV